MSKISVCMATYNGEKFIKRQLLSILSQLDDHDEVIVSDDKSSDNTLQIVRSLNDTRIKISTNQSRVGPLGNFEQAIKQAHGDFILLADQDDEWLPNKVAVLRSLLQNHDVVLSDCQVINDNSQVTYPSFFAYRNSQPGFWRNLLKNSYMGCCMAFRREILEYILPFPPKIHMHDWWIGLLVEVKGNVFFYRHPLICYRRHGGNVSPTGEDGYGWTKRIQNRFRLLWCVGKRLLA